MLVGWTDMSDARVRQMIFVCDPYVLANRQDQSGADLGSFTSQGQVILRLNQYRGLKNPKILHADGVFAFNPGDRP